VAKLLCTGHEELYQNLLKPTIKVGNNFVTQDRKDDEVSIVMQTAHIMTDVENRSFRVEV